MAKNEKINHDKLKNGIIITLTLIIVLGGSFLVSELKNNKSTDSDDSNTVNMEDVEKGNAAIEAQQEAEAVKDNEKKAHHEISVDEYLTLKEDSKKSIIYIARPTCSYCVYADPILQHIAYNYKLTINYINTDEISDAESIDIVNSDDYFKDGYGTPLILIVKNNKIVDVYEGLTNTKNYVAFFKKNGLI